MEGSSFPPPKPVHLPSNASRRAPPHTEEQQPIIQQDTSLKRAYKKPLARGAKTNQYWSPIGAVLVAPSTSTGYYH
ncbi:hypothetical protein HMPREF3185_00185 [Porphyromonas somerae]|uniref:Uncharacterized protein n=1 Tax=Porphyromonas somerae TaxID=322095 RepID=A0A134BEE4_9PORP|nr:hypothetical protein HMPREF3184_00185 [Porphyromonadaceae bacterium KA00676]KXB78308.1 hypothetical protein HMPREF3185_00185 [Porphyromonas somerae]